MATLLLVMIGTPPYQNHVSGALRVLILNRAVSTASIGSTILQYRKLHGRTYHNFRTAEYWYQHRRYPGAVITS
jgi:hypothetical protein